MSAIPAGYKQTEVGVIPTEWEVSSLTRVADVRGGVAKNSNVAISDPISVHYLRVANVQDGFLDLADMSEIEISRHDLKRYSVLPGDVLMNEGGDLDKLGRGAIWNGEFNPCVHQNHVFVVRCKSQLLPQYLDVWTGTQPARRFFLLAGKQTTNLASISKSSLGELPVALPSLPEQRAIAAALSDVDALLAKLDQFIAKKRDLKQAAMQQLLTGQTRLPGFSGKWDILTIEDMEKARLLRLSRGNVISKKDIDRTPGDCPIYSSSVKNNGVFGTYGNYMFEEELITWSVDGGGHFFYRPKHRFSVTNVCGYMRVETKRICYQYLAVQLQLLHSRMLFDYTTKAHPSVIRKAYAVPLPTLSEQTAIATVLYDMDAELAALEARRDKTRALKQGMMQELLTGRIRLV
jgi:type I restriction enzyme, S subunit